MTPKPDKLKPGEAWAALPVTAKSIRESSHLFWSEKLASSFAEGDLHIRVVKVRIEEVER